MKSRNTIIATLLFLAAFWTNSGQTQDFQHNLGIGLFAGPQKLIGGDSDAAMIGGWGGLDLFYGVNSQFLFDLSAAAGWTRHRAPDSQIRHITTPPQSYFRTWLFPVSLNATYFFNADGGFRPFITVGGGATVWQLRYAKWKNDLFSPSGVNIYGTQYNATGNAGLGFVWFLSENILLEVGGRYSYLYDQTLDIIGSGYKGLPVNGVPNERVVKIGPGDANNGVLELRIGLKFLFKGPRDSDGDGILDRDDKCPQEPEDFDGFQDEDGCPDPDNDHDGILDLVDKCPNKAEDLDGYQDRDGCPDYDNDGDAIPDSVDKCPNRAEDMDGFQDQDGCPDLDNDGDGIPDARDKCPNDPETFNGYQDDDGCPDKAPKKEGPKIEVGARLIFPRVTFLSGSATLTPSAKATLDSVYQLLKEHPEVRVEIRGYTDNVGSAARNLELSQRRARAVKRYLVRKGIDPNRLIAIGFGEDHPIADNSTPEGRAKNRRIEFVIIK
ncbi:MAG TPA: OmpA family protein [Bacteroidetes bacterium]|nr:OmpA family protein [Bacteroidota bacterium]